MGLSRGFLKENKVVKNWRPLLRRHIYLVIVLIAAAGVLIEGAYRRARVKAATPAETVKEAVKEVVGVPSTRFVDKSSWVYLRDYVSQVVGSATPSLVLVGDTGATGVFVEPSLVLVSSAAVESMEATRVELADGTPRTGRVVGLDEEVDVALIQLDAARGTPLAWSTTDDPLSWIVAVGLNRSGSPAISLSLLSVTNVGDEVTGEIYLRNTSLDLPRSTLSAAVLDFDGRLAGYIPGSNPEEVLWGDFLEELVPRLKGQGRIRHPWLGLEVTELDSAVLEHLDRRSGLLVSAVFYQGPGWIAGARAGDLLIEINGQAVHSPEGYRGMLTGLSIGTSCELKVVRKGREIKLKAPVMEQSERKRLEAGGDWIPSLGASLKAERGVAVSEGVRVSGLRVTYLERGGLAYAAGIRDDDLLLSFDRRPVATSARVKWLLRKPGSSLVELVRGNRQLLVLLEIPKTHEAP